MTTIQNNRYTILLGAPNTRSIQVSPSLEARGIQLLRQSPSNIETNVYVDFNQPGYAVYKSHLPHFMRSYKLETRVPLLRYAAQLPELAVTECIEFSLPPIVFGWSTRTSDDTLNDWRQQNGARDISVKGRSGLVIEEPDMDDFRKMKDSHADATFPAAIDTVNMATIPVWGLLRKIATLFIATHQYPAFTDKDHFTTFLSTQVAAGPSDGDVVMSEISSMEVKEFSRKTALSGLSQSTAKVSGLESYDTVQCTHAVVEEPAYGGLWLPYVSELALYDTDTITRVVDRYFRPCLGDDAEECSIIFRRIKSEMGVLGKTEVGKQMSHLYYCIGVGIEAQAKVRFVRDGGSYIGCALEGSNFTIFVNQQEYNPGTRENLFDAIKAAGSNDMITRSIMNACGFKNDVDLWPLDSMFALRTKLMKIRSQPIKHKEIEKLAAELRFPEKRFWKTSAQMIVQAVGYLTDDKAVNDYEETDDFPIHYTSLFETDKDYVIWSCFGGSAPSFMIPGGQKMDLTKQLMANVQVMGRGGKSTSSKVAPTRVSMRMIALSLAVEDLKKMKKEKAFYNPFALPNVSRSTPNKNKMFSGSEAVLVIDALRRAADATVQVGESSKLKRRAGEDPDEAPGAKRRNVLDL